MVALAKNKVGNSGNSVLIFVLANEYILYGRVSTVQKAEWPDPILEVNFTWSRTTVVLGSVRNKSHSVVSKATASVMNGIVCL